MNPEVTPASSPASSHLEPEPAVSSLRELIDRVSGRNIRPVQGEADAGLAESLPFPFLALVGQWELKLALTLALVNPAIGGVLLVGPRGTGKTTAVRSLVDLLPQVAHSLCHYGCLPEDVESGGIDAICPNCAQKYAQGEALSALDRVRLIELPLNARLEDVIGGLNENITGPARLKLRRGILAQADRNLLYVDEVNLLSGEVANAILDAAAQGIYTIRRGLAAAAYRSRFVLIGSMNPEEGRLRPQIMDRFGLRVVVRGLSTPDERLEAYHRVRFYQSNPYQMIAQYATDTAIARTEIQAARELLPQVILPDDLARLGLALIERLQIDSLRAEIVLFEASRAYAAADGRDRVLPGDLRQIALMALRLRQSDFMLAYMNQQEKEESEISVILDQILHKTILESKEYEAGQSLQEEQA